METTNMQGVIMSEKQNPSLALVYLCKRCAYSWQSRIATKPKACPGCKSYIWDKSMENQKGHENKNEKNRKV